MAWLSRGTALSPSRLWLAASCGPPGHLQPRPGLTSLLLPPGTFRTPHQGSSATCCLPSCRHSEKHRSYPLCFVQTRQEKRAPGHSVNRKPAVTSLEDKATGDRSGPGTAAGKGGRRARSGGSPPLRPALPPGHQPAAGRDVARATACFIFSGLRTALLVVGQKGRDRCLPGCL